MKHDKETNDAIQPKQNTKEAVRMGKLSGVIASFLGSFLVFCTLGYFLDKHFKTSKPYYLLGGALLAIVTTFYEVFKLAFPFGKS